MNARYDPVTLHEAFADRFDKPARLFRAPARVNLIGEHTDYNDGFVMPANTNLYTWLAIAVRDDRRLRMHSLNLDDTVVANLDSLAPAGSWTDYLCGVMHVLQQDGIELRGADILVAGDVPMQSGLSSSAALESVTGYAMLACSGHDIDRPQLALAGQKAENDYVGMACGIMDQFVITVCERSHAIMLDCRSLDYELAPLPSNVDFLVVHSGVQRELTDGRYNLRRKECEQARDRIAARVDGVTSLRDVSREQLESAKPQLDATLYRRARHVLTENDRVRQAFDALHAEDTHLLGDVMNASHASMRDDFEISCDELDALVEIAQACPGVYGSRMVGGGFGGCTVTAIEAGRTDAVANEIRSQYEKRYNRDPWCHVLGAADRVGEVAA